LLRLWGKKTLVGTTREGITGKRPGAKRLLKESFYKHVWGKKGHSQAVEIRTKKKKRKAKPQYAEPSDTMQIHLTVGRERNRGPFSSGEKRYGQALKRAKDGGCGPRARDGGRHWIVFLGRRIGQLHNSARKTGFEQTGIEGVKMHLSFGGHLS